MASFGEITEPSSRSSCEIWDDPGSASNLSELKWERPLEVPEEVGKFFIFEGKCLWSGVRARKTIVEVNTIKEANLHLYKTPHTHHYVAVIKGCDLFMTNEVVKLLHDLVVKSKMIVTLQEKSITEYYTNEPAFNHHIIRKITTTNKSNLMNENIPQLEQPNMVTGVSAGIFTLREQLGLSATAIVMFMEPERTQVDDIEQLLQKMDMSGTAQASPNDVLASNLYT